MAVELVKFRVGVSGISACPLSTYSIFLDDTLCAGPFSIPIETAYVDVAMQVAVGEHVMRVRYSPVQDVPGAVLNIDFFSLQNYEFANSLRWLQANVVFDEPQCVDGALSPCMDRCVNLTYPSEYQIKFSTPMYKWFLLNINI